MVQTASTSAARRFRFGPAWRALRPHQWAKNLILVIPMLAAHQVFDLGKWQAVLAGFVAFSLCASAVYIYNDIADIEADRGHPTKKNRPFAAGELTIRWGLAAAPILLIAAAAIAFAVSPWFAAVLGLYFATTVGYTLLFKRLLAADITVLACLYALRLLAGGVAAEVRPSAWLLAFSLVFFLCLALVKRYAELAHRAAAGGTVANRDYGPSDLPILGSLTAAAGFNSITILSLYITSYSVRRLYEEPAILWLTLPILIYWICRVILLAHRGQMNEDPVVFAFGDKPSLLCGAGILAVAALAALWT